MFAYDPQPNPGSEVSFSCAPGGVVSVLFTNIDGHANATFIVFTTNNGFDQQGVHLVPNLSAVRTFPLTEGQSPVVHVIGPNGYTNDVSIDPADCYSATGTLQATCVDEQMTLDVDAQQTKSSQDLWWDLDGVTQKLQTMSFSDSVVIPQGSAFSATIESEHDGVVAQITDIAGCAPSTTVPSTTLPSTAMAGVGETPTPASKLPGATSAAAAARPVGDLPATGSNEMRMSFIAAILLLAGFVLVATTRRPISD